MPKENPILKKWETGSAAKKEKQNCRHRNVTPTTKRTRVSVLDLTEGLFVCPSDYNEETIGGGWCSGG